MVKVDVSSLNQISETLMITLACRAIETKHKSGIIHDSKALEIVDKVDYDLSAFYKFKHNVFSVCHRAAKIDEYCASFIQRNQNPIIISIGSGLDTRFFRIDDGKVIFVDLDLPEVMTIRKQLIPEQARSIALSFSAFDQRWVNQLNQYKNNPILVVAEGFTLYQEEDNLKKLIKLIFNSFQNPLNELIFDVCSSYQQKKSHQHVAVSKTKARFSWGIDHFKNIENWYPGLKLQSVYYYARPFFRRLGLLNLFRLNPRIGKGYAILRFKLVLPDSIE